MLREIRDRSVLITGASSGIGRAAALECGRLGARLGLAARREGQLQRLAEEIRALGAQVYFAVTDVADEAQVQRFVDQGMVHFGRIDVLVNNAGYGLRANLEETTPSDYQHLLQVNLMGAFYGIRAVLPHMKARRSGHIINVSSVVGVRAMPQSGAYSSTKFAMNGMSESLRIEVAPHGVDVSIVMPISTATEFFEVASRIPGRPAKPTGPIQSSEHVARCIVRCIRKPKPEVYAYRPARFLHALNALWPGLVDRYVRRMLMPM
jgi:3-oxoacyl-[acyl-carrier protein] reductase